MDNGLKNLSHCNRMFDQLRSACTSQCTSTHYWVSKNEHIKVHEKHKKHNISLKYRNIHNGQKPRCECSASGVNSYPKQLAALTGERACRKRDSILKPLRKNNLNRKPGENTHPANMRNRVPTPRNRNSSQLRSNARSTPKYTVNAPPSTTRHTPRPSNLE